MMVGKTVLCMTGMRNKDHVQSIRYRFFLIPQRRRSGSMCRASALPIGGLGRHSKKSPAVRRGKTDSLEISQRGKEDIYTKFMSGRKLKMN
jgi:hypothetical protein